MKSTTVVSLTKIAQMLTSRIGRKPLLLALAATLACLQTAMAATDAGNSQLDGQVERPRGHADAPANMAQSQTWKQSLSDAGKSYTAGTAGGPDAAERGQADETLAPGLNRQGSVHHTAGGPNRPSSERPKASPYGPESGQNEWTRVRFSDNEAPTGQGNDAQKYGVWYRNTRTNEWTKDKPAGYKLTEDANKNFFQRYCIAEGLIGAAGVGAVGMAGYVVDEALQKIGESNTEAKEVLTCFGEKHTGNILAWFMCFVAALGFAAFVGALAYAFSAGHKGFTAWMSGVSFASMACLMMCFNFMQQDAANAGVAFTKAITFGADNAGEGTNSNFAEWGATASVWASLILFVMIGVLIIMFATKRSCFANRV